MNRRDICLAGNSDACILVLMVSIMVLAASVSDAILVMESLSNDEGL